MAKLVDDKIKKMLQQTIESIFLKSDTRHGVDRHDIKIMAAMTGSAIYSAAHYWLNAEEKNQTEVLADIVRPYVMNGLGLANP